MKSDHESDNGDHEEALKQINTINNLFTYSSMSVPSLIDLVNIYIIKEDYGKAEKQLKRILDIDDMSFNDKNHIEEMLSFVKQKMNI